MDEQSLLDKIAKDPNNETTYLVYADWLEEQGQNDRAELIRLELEAENLPNWSPKREKLQNRRSELLDHLRANWNVLRQVPGDITVNWLRGLPTQIQFLWSSAHQVSTETFQYVLQFPFLQSLVTSGHFPPEWLESLSESANLHTLHITNRTKDHVQPLLSLPHLQNLTISGYFESFIPQLVQFPRLKSLALYGQIENETCLHIGQLQSLRSLRLCTNAKAPEDGLAHLVSLTKLEELYLPDFGMTSEGCEHIGQLVNLKKLELIENEIKDEGVKYLVPLQQLQVLDLTETDISNKSYPYLAKLKKLKGLDLRYNFSLDGKGLSKLKDLPELEELDISWSEVRLDDLVSLLEFPNLKFVRTSSDMFSEDEEDDYEEVERWETAFQKEDILMDVHWE
ncbi:MAG: TIGR02996 domain-containing protein [Gemmataceae bacterium]